MRVAISIPQPAADGTFDPTSLRGYLARAEALGFDSAWTGEQVIGSMPYLGPIETMSYAAACTERLRIGCIAFVSSLHNPLQLAKSMATLDQLSRGRLEVGLAIGGGSRRVSGLGVVPGAFVVLFNKRADFMKVLLAVTLGVFDGLFWAVNGSADGAQ